jgi:type IV fimbrial biogenesis protein FimT
MKSLAYKSDGFTIIEVLTTIVILGVLAAIAMPAFSKLMPGIRVSSAARQIATDLQLAKMRAIAQHTAQTVTFTQSSSSYTFGADTRSLGTLYPGTTITNITGGNPVFTTTGTASTWSITISNGGQTKQVSLTPIGRVSVQ